MTRVAFTVTLHHGRSYLLAEASGPCGIAELSGSADLMRTVAHRLGYRRVLADLRQTQPTLSFTEHLQLGSHIAAALGDLERVATVVQQQDRVGTSEKAAQKSGLRFRTFTDLAEAQAWISAAPETGTGS
jgi:hypothetical protein